jgi:hypothetical protein
VGQRVVNAPLRAIALRRTNLTAEIEEQRAAMTEALAGMRIQLAFAGLGLVATRILVRRPWLRAAVLGLLGAVAALRLAR